MPGLWGKIVRMALAGLVAAGLVLAGSGAAGADPGERITRYDVDVAVHRDGTAHVRESITYDFGGSAKHGIERKIPYSAPAGRNRFQKMDVTGIRVNSPDAPAQTDVTDDGRYRVVRVGDPGKTITGVHTYVIQYDTGHVATKAGDGVRYAWNAVGDEWDVPISNVTVHLGGPAAINVARCFAGPQGSSGACESGGASGTEARFTQGRLGAREGVTVQADFPAGSITVAPEYVHAVPVSLLPDTGTGIAIGVLLLIAAAGRGYGRFRRRGHPVLPGLPEGMTPGLAAYLLRLPNENKVMGTLVDLARRGLLRIEDVPEPAFGQDWTLTRTRPSEPGLAPHERAILDGLFTSCDEVRVRDLQGTFYTVAAEASRALADDAERRGWFRSPRARRIVVACAVPFLLFALAQPVVRDLDGWPFLMVASLLAGWTLVRRVRPLFWYSDAGDASRRQVEALRNRLADPDHADETGAEWALPYIVALGQMPAWEMRLADGAVPWPAFYSGEALGAFTASAGLAMSYPPSSGSSGHYGGYSGGGGFVGGGSVGGGGGGGGGGSW